VQEVTVVTTHARKAVVILGAGPGLGLSIARRFGRAGYVPALVSRSAARHAGYLASLAEDGIDADSLAADVRDGAQVRSALDTIADRHGVIEVLYYGPAAVDPAALPKPITQTDPAAVHEAMSWVYPAIDVTGHVLPAMMERGSGGLLFAGGLSSIRPMPALGALAVSSAALRNYAVTLNAGLAGTGVYAGALTIGGLIERGDIYRFVASRRDQFGDAASVSLDPDEIADTAWDLYTKRDRAEATFGPPEAGMSDGRPTVEHVEGGRP
jgi:NAD(P)-dependent dehydrogenase (short-subunit alcohol dehydrogenase family)